MAKKSSKSTTPAVASQPVAPVVASPAPAPAPKPEAPTAVYAVATPEWTAPRGFAQALFAELLKGPGTIAEVADRMLKSGEFQRTAPQAAAKRALKPTSYLCRTWAAAGVLTTGAAKLTQAA